MSYSINEVSKYFNISAYTIRFYEKEGLLPFVSRNKYGNREFTESDVKIFATICCLKDSGMSLKGIKIYIDWVMQGSSTINQREKLLTEHRKAVVKQIDTLKESLEQIDAKIEGYRAPNAAEVISQQIKWIANEKSALELTSGFSYKGKTSDN